MYCKICGGKKVDEWTGYYDPGTGDKRMRQVCSVDRCHDGHDYVDYGFWKMVFTRKARECSRCGKEQEFSNDCM